MSNLLTSLIKIRSHLMPIAISVFCLTACVHSGTQSDNSTSTAAAAPDASNENVIVMWSTALKDRGGRYDVNFNLRNMREDQSVVIPLDKMTCSKGTGSGQLHLVGKGEKTVLIKPGQTQTLHLSCTLASKPAGDYIIGISRVFIANLNGTPTARVAAKDLSWHYVEAN